MELDDKEKDDFSLAFEAASVGEPPADAPPAEDPPKEDPPADDPPAEDPPKEEGPPAEDSPKEEPPPAEVPPKTVEPPKIEEPPKEEVELVPEEYSPEESTAIETMVSEFPEVAAGIQAELRVLQAKIQNLVRQELSAVKNQLKDQFTPALSEAAVSAQERFKRAVLGAHEDAFAILPEVDKWVATKPTFLQQTYNAVLDGGTAADTITLLNLFKQETKVAAKKEGLPVKKETPPVDPEKEKKLEAQESVRGRQTITTGGIDEDDFESAFNAAATHESKPFLN